MKRNVLGVSLEGMSFSIEKKIEYDTVTKSSFPTLNSAGSGFVVQRIWKDRIASYWLCISRKKHNISYDIIYVCNDICTVFHTLCIRCYAITSIMTGQGPRNHSQPLTNVGLSWHWTIIVNQFKQYQFKKTPLKPLGKSHCTFQPFPTYQWDSHFLKSHPNDFRIWIGMKL